MTANNENWFENNFPSKDLSESEQKIHTHTHVSSGIAPLDISTIKNIYEKAVRMRKLEEEADTDLDFKMPSKQENLLSFSDSAFDLTLESNTAGKPDSVPQEAANGFIPTQVLCDGKNDFSARSPTYIKTREENNRLHLLLKVREEELSLLREKYKSHEMELRQARAELEEMHKARKKALVVNKEDEIQDGHLHARVEMLEQDLKYCQDARDRVAKEVIRVERDFNLEREARAKLEGTLHRVIQEKQRDILILEENWKRLHENEVARLKRTIDELSHKLNREEEIRRCVQTGMNSLHRHFNDTQ